MTNFFSKDPLKEVAFDAIKIEIASPEAIKSWSYGEVKRAETYNYRTLKPEKDGLLCSVIFGTIKSYECLCGKYRKYKYKGIVCEKCGVEVTESSVRRDRMGHINLVCPVVHTWFLHSSPSCISVLLDMPLKNLEKITYFESHIVIDSGITGLNKMQLLREEEYEEALGQYGEGTFTALTGAEAIRTLLTNLNLAAEKESLATQLGETKSVIKKTSLIRRLGIIDNFLQSNNKPEWMVIEVLPVLPADLRPCVVLEADKFVSSDLNDLYRRIINRNNRLKNLKLLGAPDIIIKNEMRMLQEAVDTLFDNEKRTKVTHANGRLYKSLSDVLSGKQGRFRQNLLGKRVDYSGRSVIVVGPRLRLYQCGLPRRMALELFKPFIYSKLILFGHAISVKSAKSLVEERDPVALEVLEGITSHYPVLLNRAPTLHKLGIQAFEPILTNGNAIQLHPLVCSAFNADFDGDQMAVHIPLSIESQTEARVLMLASNNILSPSSGDPVIVPTQDIILGLYIITNAVSDAKKSDKIFSDVKDITYALEVTKEIEINSTIKFLNIIRDDSGNIIKSEIIETIPGRVMLYRSLPDSQTAVSFEVFNKLFTKKDVAKMFEIVYEKFPNSVMVDFADSVLQLGFKYATHSGISIGKDDMIIPETKAERIQEAFEKVEAYEKQFSDGYITHKEKYNKVTDTWQECANQISSDMMVGFKRGSDTKSINSIYMMAHSGARGSVTQIKQLAAMRGLVVKTSGEIIETPIVSNFKEGLSVSECFNSAHGARKGLADTALKTADAGYLTRRLVDVAQNCVITEPDCRTGSGVAFKSRFDKNRIVKHVSQIANGRFLAKDVKDSSGKVLIKAGDFVTKDLAETMEKQNIHEVEIRSVIRCESRVGVCQKCYGMDIVTKKLAELGQPVGIIAAQSIGEPGTQLTMRTFHVGGVAFKTVNKPYVTSDEDGIVSFVNLRGVKSKEVKYFVVSNSASIIVESPNGKTHKYPIPYGSRLIVEEGQEIKKGEKIADLEVYTIPIISEYSGTASYSDLLNGISYKEEENEETGKVEKTILESNLHPSIKITDSQGKYLKHDSGNSVMYYLPVGATLLVDDGSDINVGDLIASLPKTTQKTRDITGGLPRVVDLFEARKPKNSEIISPCNGTVTDIRSYKTKKKVIIQEDGDGETIEFSVPGNAHVTVHSGARIYRGDVISPGEKNPYDILKINGIDELVAYILNEIQLVYELQGVKINDKHIEVILNCMLTKVEITDSGDSLLFAGQKVSKFHLKDVVRKLQDEGKTPPSACVVLEGITKSALQNDSFIAAASFQETVKVLTFAAIEGKRDDLVGIKENVVVGNLIPAGTGFSERKFAKIVDRLRSEQS